MESKYFESMYSDAVCEDATVFPDAVARFACGEIVRRKLPDPWMVGDFWVGIPFDRIMELSRGLAELDCAFQAKLATLLVQGRIHVLMYDAETGKPVWVRDPLAITGDDAPMPVGLFHQLMMQYPTETSIKEG